MILDPDNWREIGHALASSRLRTFLTAFGVFWAMFMLVVMLGSGNGLSNGITQEFQGTATNSFFLWSQRTTKPWRGMRPGRPLSMDEDDVEAVRRGVPELEIVAPRTQLGGWDRGNNVTRGVKSGGFQVVGATPELERISPTKLKAGRFLNPLDLEEGRKVAVIGTRPHQVLFAPGEEPIGEYVRIQGVEFIVVGAMADVRGGEDADRDAQTIYIPFTTFQRAFGEAGRVGWITALTKPGSSASIAEARTKEILNARHQVAPDDHRAFGSWNMEEEYEKVNGLFTGIRILVWIVGTGTLAAGVVGVSNIMLVIVKERTHEIGVRRAIGATPRAVMSQIMLESVLLTSVAGWLGLCAGVGVLELVARGLEGAPSPGDGPTMFLDPGVAFGTVVQALLILVTAGVLAGVVPARRAVALSPVEALRSNP